MNWSGILKKAVPVALGAGVLFLFFRPLFFLLLQIAGLAMMALSAAVMVVTFRKAKAVSPRSLLISISMSILSAVIVVIVSKAIPSAGLTMLGMTVGGTVGGGWALTTRVFAEDGKVRSRGSGWYLAVWVMSLMLTQGIPMLTGRTPAAALVVLFLGTGIVLGNSSVMLARWWLVRPVPAPPL